MGLSHNNLFYLQLRFQVKMGGGVYNLLDSIWPDMQCHITIEVITAHVTQIIHLVKS